jgi:hypothetical protein
VFFRARGQAWPWLPLLCIDRYPGPLAAGGLVEEIERLRAEPGEGDIAIDGATLAAEAAALGLIDEYQARVYPVLVGGGIPPLVHRAPGRTGQNSHHGNPSALPRLPPQAAATQTCDAFALTRRPSGCTLI